MIDFIQKLKFNVARYSVPSFFNLCRRYIIIQVLLASVPILLGGLIMSVNLLQDGFDAVNRVNGELNSVFEGEVNDLEQEVWRLTDENFARAAKLEEYAAKLKVQEQKFVQQRNASEIRNLIIKGSVPYSHQLVAALGAQKKILPSEIVTILTTLFDKTAMATFFWKSRKEMESDASLHGFSNDFIKYAGEAFGAGKSDWFEDDFGAKDIAVSIMPIKSRGSNNGVYCLVFDISDSYSQYDNAERLGLSVEASKLQEQRLREGEKNKHLLQKHREEKKALIAENKSATVLAILDARKRLMLFQGATMVVLISLVLFLFWWLGTRRVTLLKNWLASITEGKLSDAVDGAKFFDGEGRSFATPGGFESVNNDHDSMGKKIANPASQRIQALTDDEIGELGKSINCMLDSLEKTTVSKNLLLWEIEERKKVELRLSENQQRLKKILDAVQAGVVLIDAENHTVVYVNTAAEKMIGIRRDNIIGRECYGLICPAERGKCPIDDLGKLVDNSQQVLLTATGEKMPIIKTETEITLEGEKYFIASFVDITELEKTKRQMEEAMQQVERVSKVKSQFLANMSHEIRTPLNGVIGMSQLALDTELNSDQRNIVSTISKEANSLLRIINDILDFSKIEAGKLELESISFDLYSLCEEAVQTIIYNGEQKGLEIIFFIDPSIPSSLLGDPGRLRQIIMNLCGNALKFTREGEIFIKVEMQQDYGDGVLVAFSIKDSGIGISPEKLVHIFESFTQADGSTTRLYGGTGLGTAISKQLVELMGGTIAVESELGQGSIFRFTVPFVKTSEQAVCDPALSLSFSMFKGVKVLIVDDNPTNLFILEEYLNSWGCIPEKAGNGSEALELYRNVMGGISAFDLIITDFNMPEMNGLSLIKEIRRLENGELTVPVIVLTSSNSKGDVTDWEKLSISEYITKPILRQKLKDIVHRTICLEGGKVVRSFVDRQGPEEDVGTICEGKYRILLAEDYPTNQLVATNFLTKAGYVVDVAENGKDAFNLFKQNTYDMVLMDIQMPEMDGYEATRVIREHELHRPEFSKTPIIAMTAHAMKGYREKCILGGMDDYIAKPLQRKELIAVAEKWLSGGNRQAFAESASNSACGVSVEPCPVNMQILMEQLEGDREIARELFLSLSGTLSVRKVVLQQAVDEGNNRVVRDEAHGIKGAALNVAAFKLAETAKQLEKIGEHASTDEVPGVFDRLLTDIDQFVIFANKYIEGENYG